MQTRIIVAALAVLLVGAAWYGVHTKQHRELSARHKSILSQLRQIDAAIDGFRSQHGRYPASLEEIVGPDKFINKLESFDGEDYRSVDVSGIDILRVRTRDAIAIVYSRTTHTAVNAAP